MAVKVNFIGRLGANAELVTSQQTPFISLRTAVNDRVNREDVTIWMSVTADYNRFKNMVQYLTQGTVVNITGTERCSTYNAKNGTVGIDRKVIADSIEFVNIGRKNDSNQNETSNAEMTTGGLRQSSQPATAATAPAPAPAAAPSMVADDDLPF